MTKDSASTKTVTQFIIQNDFFDVTTKETVWQDNGVPQDSEIDARQLAMSLAGFFPEKEIRVISRKITTIEKVLEEWNS